MRQTMRSGAAVMAFLCLAGGLAVIGCDFKLPGPDAAPPAEVPPPKSDAPTPAQEKRAAAIRDTLKALRAECDRNAGGDWDKWVQQLSGFRAELKNKIGAAKANDPMAPGSFEAREPVLEGRDNFGLFESAPAWYLPYLYEPQYAETFRAERPVVAGARWLRERGIDVIFVPVPKMMEVYPEYFVDHCPADRIVAPHVRRTLHELLEADVEVVDLLPLFLKARTADSAPLYLPADPHWAPRGQTVAAQAIAERLKRYDFVTTALAGPQTWVYAEAPYPPITDSSVAPAYGALSPEQQQRARGSHPSSHILVANLDRKPLRSPTSPVVFIGDSYNGGLVDLVSKEINLPVHLLSGAGQTTQAFKEFVRDPDLLKDCRVVVWVVCNTSFRATWPLPRVVRESLDGVPPGS